MPVAPKLHVLDLFALGVKSIGEKKGMEPFTHEIQFLGPQGERVKVKAYIDNGAMKEVTTGRRQYTTTKYRYVHTHAQINCVIGYGSATYQNPHSDV